MNYPRWIAVAFFAAALLVIASLVCAIFGREYVVMAGIAWLVWASLCALGLMFGMGFELWTAGDKS